MSTDTEIVACIVHLMQSRLAAAVHTFSVHDLQYQHNSLCLVLKTHLASDAWYAYCICLVIHVVFMFSNTSMSLMSCSCMHDASCAGLDSTCNRGVWVHAGALHTPSRSLLKSTERTLSLEFVSSPPNPRVAKKSSTLLTLCAQG